jgi:hypothetical protein
MFEKVWAEPKAVVGIRRQKYPSSIENHSNRLSQSPRVIKRGGDPISILLLGGFYHDVQRWTRGKI